MAKKIVEAKLDFKGRLLERLRDPIQLRIVVTSTVLLVAYLGIYTPLSGQIAETTAKLQHEQRLYELATTVEGLQTEYKKFKGHLAKQTDSKEWVRYVLDGIRQFPLGLVGLDCDAQRDMGPYKAVVLRIDLEGAFYPMDALLRWIEGNPRIFRIDSLRVSPSRSNKHILLMQLTVLGVMG